MAIEGMALEIIMSREAGEQDFETSFLTRYNSQLNFPRKAVARKFHVTLLRVIGTKYAL